MPDLEFRPLAADEMQRFQQFALPSASGVGERNPSYEHEVASGGYREGWVWVALRQGDLVARDLSLELARPFLDTLPFAGRLTGQTRVDGPDVAQRGPGLTPGPVIQMGNFNAASHEIEADIGAWYAQHRLPFMAAMPGCIGARKLLATAGWGKHSILYEFVSLEAREARFVPHEEQAHDPGSWTARILSLLCHAPCSPAVGRRIWPAVRDS